MVALKQTTARCATSKNAEPATGGLLRYCANLLADALCAFCPYMGHSMEYLPLATTMGTPGAASTCMLKQYGRKSERVHPQLSNIVSVSAQVSVMLTNMLNGSAEDNKKPIFEQHTAANPGSIPDAEHLRPGSIKAKGSISEN